MEPRAKTLIERFGFVDPDRRKHKHDEIQIWVYRNFPSIVRQMFPLLVIDDDHLDLKLEYPVTDISNNKNFVIGFIDIYCRKLGISIEVKSEMPSIGELLRQIQFYKRYISGTWIVVSPDNRNVEILKEQGIHFFKYRSTDEGQLSLFDGHLRIVNY